MFVNRERELSFLEQRYASGQAELDELMRKATLLKTAGAPKRVHYALFARAGFTPALCDRASAQGARLVDLSDLMRQRQTTVGAH
jgi:hypothetical protein